MTGLLLINLGSPDQPYPKEVKTYLDEFLMDERVIDIAYWKRVLLVKGIILNTRPKKSAAAYQKIWTKEGSPLVVISKEVKRKVQEKMGDKVKVVLGMRYGNPSIKSALEELQEAQIKKIIVLPLYPQYAMSSSETVVEKFKSDLEDLKFKVEFDIIEPFYNDPLYLESLKNSISNQINVKDYDEIIFSYHSIPERHIFKSDTTKSHCKIDKSCCTTASEAHKTCYRHQCFFVTDAMVEKLGLKPHQFRTTFQSKLGRAEWLKPSTSETLTELPKQGIKKIAILTPAFVSDCLETLEEIRMEGKESFLEAGGEKFDVIECLNVEEQWIDTIVKWTKNRM